jgi:acyl-CoA synthetase (AMP-forming)/AMP-acid ligase II
MFFAAGGGGRFPPVLRGAKVVIMQYDVELVLKAIETERVTHFTMSPTPIKRIVEHPDIGKYDLSSVHVVGLTGASHPLAEIRRVEEVFEHVWYSGWGMTETGACGIILEAEEVAIDGPSSGRMASVGKPMFGVDVRAVDENGRDIVHDGKDSGELLVRGDIVTQGYWNMPSETAEALKDGWLRTGDVVTIDEDGYIYIVDRKKDMIKSGGILISAREIEEVIYTHSAVSQCAVIGVVDEEWGETPKAVVVLKDGMLATAEEIIALCKQNLASYKKPTSVDFVASLPINSTGKILKKELRERYAMRSEESRLDSMPGF